MSGCSIVGTKTSESKLFAQTAQAYQSKAQVASVCVHSKAVATGAAATVSTAKKQNDWKNTRTGQTHLLGSSFAFVEIFLPAFALHLRIHRISGASAELLQVLGR